MKSAIESAITWNDFIFWGYVGVLVVGAILTVIWFTSGNRVQKAIAIQADADARLRDADARLKSSEERIAGLKTEYEKARAEITKAQADVAKAIERTSALEIEKDRQRELAAIAERKLLALQEGIEPRRLTLPKQTRLIEELSKGEKGEIAIQFVSGNAEAENFAIDIEKVLHVVGWTVSHRGSATFLGKMPVGIEVTMQDPNLPRIRALISAFEHIGILVIMKIKANASGLAVLTIGNRP